MTTATMATAMRAGATPASLEVGPHAPATSSSNKVAFPRKLFAAMEQRAFCHAIDWDESGRSVLVKDIKALEEVFLPAVWARE